MEFFLFHAQNFHKGGKAAKTAVLPAFPKGKYVLFFQISGIIKDNYGGGVLLYALWL